VGGAPALDAGAPACGVGRGAVPPTPSAADPPGGNGAPPLAAPPPVVVVGGVLSGGAGPRDVPRGAGSAVALHPVTNALASNADGPSRTRSHREVPYGRCARVLAGCFRIVVHHSAPFTMRPQPGNTGRCAALTRTSSYFRSNRHCVRATFGKRAAGYVAPTPRFGWVNSETRARSPAVSMCGTAG
jgi:hypothetical protein